MTLQLMTQANYARHRGVTRPAVSNWKKAGLLVLAEDPADGRIKVDVARSDARINGRVDPGRGRPANAPASPELPIEASPSASAPAPSAAAGGGESLQSVRMELIRHQTAGHVLKNAREAGELAPVQELQRRAAEMGRAARERMQAWFRAQAERFAAERDPRTLMALGEEGIDQVFSELADAAAAGAFAEDEDSAAVEAELEAAAAAEAGAEAA
jgi:hypothetical protein